MDTLFACLGRLNDRPLGTVVHVGAGRARILERYAALAAERIVLVEGAPEIGAELARQAATHPRMTVHRAVVAPRNGTIGWHRYNLASLNGPLDAEALRPYFARLRALPPATVDTVALVDLL